MADNDTFDARLRQFLAVEANSADSYGSVDDMVGLVGARAQRRVIFPSRVLFFALLMLALIAALALSMAAAGSKLRLDGLFDRMPQRPGLIAYAISNELHVLDPDTGVDRVVYHQDRMDGVFRGWTLDGSRLIMQDEFMTRIIAPDGSPGHAFTNGVRGVWSPDAQHYAAVDGIQITVRNTDDQMVEKVDLPSGFRNLDWMEWTSDSRALAVSLYRCTANDCPTVIDVGLPRTVGPEDIEELWVMPIDGRSPYSLVVAQVGTILFEPAAPYDWSPDSTLTAVNTQSCSPPIGGTCINGFDLIDGRTGQSTFHYSDASFLGWSPDGSLLTIATGTGGDCPAIAVVHRDGSDVRTVASCGFSPSWSANGERIAYFSGTDGLHGDVHVVNIDGTNDHVAFSGPNSFDWQRFDAASH